MSFLTWSSHRQTIYIGLVTCAVFQRMVVRVVGNMSNRPRVRKRSSRFVGECGRWTPA